MANWFSDKRWIDYITRREALHKDIFRGLCGHMKTAMDSRFIELDLQPSNYDAEAYNFPQSGGFKLYDADYGGVGDLLLYCPWCGKKLPKIPKIFI